MSKLKAKKLFKFEIKDAKNAKKIKDKNPSSLRVKIEATHSGLVNDNKFFYLPKGMAAGASSFVKPYKKPLLKNHDRYGEPLGRVQKASYVQYDDYKTPVNSAKDPKKIYKQVQDWAISDTVNKNSYKGLGHIELIVDITDKDAIEKVLDGRYQTVSISGTTDKAICSICGTDLMNEESPWSHDHQRGGMYDGKEMFLISGNMKYDEVSFVNVPADKNVNTEILKDSQDSKINDIIIQDSANVEIIDYETKGDVSPMKLSDLLNISDLYKQKIANILDELGLSTAMIEDEALNKLRKTSFLFAEDKLVPVHDKAHILAAYKLLEEVEDSEELEEVMTLLDGKYGRKFGKSVSFEDALESLKEEISDESGEEGEQASSINYDELVSKITDSVVDKLKESMTVSDASGDSSYSALRVDVLEQEIEALEAENKKLSDDLRGNVINQIMRLEDKVGDEDYEARLKDRSLDSLQDKLTDISEDITGEASESNASDELDTNVDVNDAADETGSVDDNSNDNTTAEDNTDSEERLSVTQVRDMYKKTIKEKGLAAASKLLKDLREEGKLPHNFSLNVRG